MSKKSKFRKQIETAAAIVTLFAVGFILASALTDGADPWFTFAMIFGTTSYHFIMRLAVGQIVSKVLPKNVDYNGFWFREKKFERKLYAFLGVKKWKRKRPTYNPDDFSLKQHTYGEIIQTMCCSEIVHEVVLPLCFVPLLFSLFGDLFWLNFSIMAVTSVISAAVESQFIVMQRFNRPRLIRLKLREERKEQ